METLLQDLRYAARRLARTPGFTAVVVLTLALGIGANSAIFSVVSSVLLTKLPYADPSRLVLVWEHKGASDHNVVNPGNYLDWKSRQTVFAGFAGLTWSDLTFTGGQPERVSGRAVTPDFFGVLGVAPALGRTFTAEEARPNGPEVVVLSDGLWRRRFGADPAIVGRSVPVAGGSVTVLGVMPSSFRPLPWNDEEYWKPLPLGAADQAIRTGRYLMTVARLRDGITIAQAQAQLAGIARSMEAQYPEFDTGWSTNVVPLMDQEVGSARVTLELLLAAVGLVLLIACANVANLLMARYAAQEHDRTVRLALGASRWRLTRQVLAESLLLSLGGGALGLLLAAWGIDALLAAAPPEVPRLADIHLDGRTFWFAALIAVLAGVLFSLPLAVRTRATALPQGGARTTDGTPATRTRSLLVVLQTSLAIVLLAGAGLLVRSLQRLAAVNPGFDPTHLSAAIIEFPPATYPDSSREILAFGQTLERVRALPGVQAAGLISWLPMTPGNAATSLTVVGRPAPLPGQAPVAAIRIADPGLFGAMGIPLKRGRLIAETDGATAAPVAVISEALAAKLWPHQDPLGQRVKVSWTHPDREVEIVGVVGDIRHEGLDAEKVPMLYYPFAQEPQGGMYLVVRSGAGAAALTPLVRSAVGELDREVPVPALETMDAHIADTMANRRYPMVLISLFAVLALVIAGVGLYGLLAYAVGRRTREFGVRLALGAAPRDVLTMVMKGGLGLTLAGIGLGWLGAWGAGRALSSLLYDVRPMDPVTFLAVGAVFTLVALAATALPARRAARVDPIVALRAD